MIDLHTHTRHSDGTTSPTENAELAARAGLTGLALTDHDTLDGWDEAAEACGARGLAFVPGIELSTEEGGYSVHLLGYWIDPEHEPLLVECDRLRNEREHRARRMVALLTGLGAGVEFAHVQALAGTAPIGRPHVAAALVAAGHVPDLDTAFVEFLADGGPAYVPKYALSPEDGVRLLRAAGGAVVLAHPGLSERGDGPVDLALVERLIAAGIVGLEADHPGHDEEETARWRALAAERDLLVTGASDFHGEHKVLTIGERTTPTGVVEALAERAVPARLP